MTSQQAHWYDFALWMLENVNSAGGNQAKQQIMDVKM